MNVDHQRSRPVAVGFPEIQYVPLMRPVRKIGDGRRRPLSKSETGGSQRKQGN